MKKIISVALVTLLVFTLSLTAMAAEFEVGSLVDSDSVAFEAKKATVEQKFDGKISEGEYYKVDYTADMLSFTASGEDNTESKSLKFDQYLAWDDNNIRAAVVYKKGQTYVNEYDMDGAGNIWDATAAQYGFSMFDSDEFLELGYGRNSADGSLLHTVWRDSIESGFEPVAGTNYTVALVDGDLVYEIAVPWTAFAPAAQKLGDTIGYCLVVAGGRGAGDYVHAQIAAGITGGKDGSRFAKVKLVEAPPAPVEETKPVDEVKPGKNPTTSDATAIMYVLATISTLGGAVVLGKRK